MTDREQAARDIMSYLDDHRAAAADFLASLVRIPSDNPPGDCAPHAAQAASLLEQLGLPVERHEVDAALVKQVGMMSATNLIIRHRFGPGPTIALNAHGDVVPPGEGWTRDPFGAEIIDGWMYGRGVAVSKSDFATYAFALLALIKTNVALHGTVELHLTYDEESGGEIGPGLLLKAGLSKPDYAICAGFSYAVITAHNGCLHLEVTVNGKSAHAAKPATGIDALEAATFIMAALYRWRSGLAGRVSQLAGIGSPQLTIGLIKGGINTNVVPERVVFRLDRRMTPEENAADVEAELRAIIEREAANYATNVSIERILRAAPLTPLPGSDRLSAALCRRASAIMGEPVTTSAVPLYTDARHYAEAGIPVVLYGAGPHTIEEANAHRADERLPLDDLHKATAVVALSLLDLLA
jgi:acetylornithine deacetylase/succinyl-diaminopimelate desuccinylase family protein